MSKERFEWNNPEDDARTIRSYGDTVVCTKRYGGDIVIRQRAIQIGEDVRGRVVQQAEVREP